jgi:hypothetical protein
MKRGHSINSKASSATTTSRYTDSTSRPGTPVSPFDSSVSSRDDHARKLVTKSAPDLYGRAASASVSTVGSTIDDSDMFDQSMEILHSRSQTLAVPCESCGPFIRDDPSSSDLYSSSARVKPQPRTHTSTLVLSPGPTSTSFRVALSRVRIRAGAGTRLRTRAESGLRPDVGAVFDAGRRDDFDVAHRLPTTSASPPPHDGPSRSRHRSRKCNFALPLQWTIPLLQSWAL